MTTSHRPALMRALLLGVSAVTMTTMVAAPAAAQTSTGTIAGRVTDASGAPVAGAVVSAVNAGTGQTSNTTTDANGSYVLAGLRPANYTIRTTVGGATVERQFAAEIGRRSTLDLSPDAVVAADPAAPAGAVSSGGEVVVTGRRLAEVKTSEVATNVSQEQIRSLPQTDRNFLSFAKLAPGVTYNDSETDKEVRSGASTAAGVNVFIDGTSIKNQILDSGVAGQENSRGNPFGQIAVQEFRVLTQNFKAEYEQASAAVIVAATKSGTNEFHGEVFGQYTGKGLSKQDVFTERRGQPEPEFKRKQYGVALGGPIIKDRLFFFGAYEGNDQNRAFNVALGNRSPENLARFGEYEGSFVSPFRGDFYFGKLTGIAGDHTIDLSYSRRKESDIQGFGGQTAFTAAENKINIVDTYNGKWTWRGDSFINEFDVNYLKYAFNPTSLNPDDPSFDYQGVITFGGKDSTQRLVQKSFTARNDFTFTGVEGHTIKAGVKLANHSYDFNKSFFAQPRYFFRNDTRNTPGTGDDLTFDFPAEARLGTGDPNIRALNTAIGLYIQDDWQVTDKLELNLGLRWDYESNMFNNNYRTPDAAVAALRGLTPTDYFDPDDYITDGNDRKPFLGMFQPRIGFSYDLFGNRDTVIFGGYGRYFDRNVFNNTLDERFRLQYDTGVFYFSQDGQPRDGNPTVRWDPRYLTREGLLELRATDATGLPELFAVKNDARPPRTDQFSLGVRQRFGEWQASATGSYIRGKNGYTHLFATRRADNGDCCDTAVARANGFGNVLIGADELDTRYKAIYLTLDKPYTRTSGWGFGVAYTLAESEQNGNDLFSLDKATPDEYGFRPKPGDERHRLVLNGILDLPAGFKISTLSQFGSGAAFQVFDARNGGGINEREITSFYPVKNCIKGVFAFCEVNVTVENNIRVFGDATINVAVDFLNVFNNKNYGGWDGYLGNRNYAITTDFLAPEDGSIELLKPNNLQTLPRRIQLRAGFRF
ncbi:carboxypeptidase regulatory-like domain-containing protein [Sphingomonas sp. LY29]|uniref:TonB-dependent receptor n=1 Tax=Sphingomonas sp. LY29 TaxID=3095341 RepID=UPI002D77E653|nr:carboxypeptidase regulatory-like domain-containing protein [Sphingomonas sp. LY29]WRP26751.1 carboxypeptidase regulatory-like domain-containing protein [Sphingomonas sp. LY29]